MSSRVVNVIVYRLDLNTCALRQKNIIGLGPFWAFIFYNIDPFIKICVALNFFRIGLKYLWALVSACLFPLSGTEVRGGGRPLYDKSYQ